MPKYIIPKVKDLPPKRRGLSGRKRVVVVTHKGSGTLEYIGPIQALEEANFFLDFSGRADLGYDIEVVTTKSGPLFELKGLKIVADRPYYEVSGDVDTIFFQAIDTSEETLKDKDFIKWVGSIARRTRRIASICVGTFYLAEAGILDGKCATTHWMASPDLSRRYPKVNIESDPIYVKDGKVYTSAGSMAGLDLTIALIEEDFGRDLARRVAQSMVMYLKRPGNQAQFSVHILNKSPEEDRIRSIQMFIENNPRKDLSVETLALRARMSPRNFSRVFSKEVGQSPGKFVELSRLERARRLLEETDLSVSQIAAKCGYATPDGLRMSLQRHLKINPSQYRNRFSSSQRAAGFPGARRY